MLWFWCIDCFGYPRMSFDISKKYYEIQMCTKKFKEASKCTIHVTMMIHWTSQVPPFPYRVSTYIFRDRAESGGELWLPEYTSLDCFARNVSGVDRGQHLRRVVYGGRSRKNEDSKRQEPRGHRTTTFGGTSSKTTIVLSLTSMDSRLLTLEWLRVPNVFHQPLNSYLLRPVHLLRVFLLRVLESNFRETP